MNCHLNYKTPYDILREECKSCLTKVCIIPSVNNEMGEWYQEWLGHLEGWRDCFRGDIDDKKKEYMDKLGKLIDEAFNQAPQKYGSKIVKDAQEKTGIGQTMIYIAHKYYLSDMYRTDPSYSWAQVKKLIESKGDQKVLSQECEHKETELIRRCLKCGKVVK